jgi:RimJ/RimL family protein N-acetyltransferase
MGSPTFPILTERLRLRPFEDGDFDALHAMHGREDVMRFTVSGALPRERTADLLERIKPKTDLDGPAQGIRLAALLRDDEVLVGDFSCWRTSAAHRQGEIGFIVHPEHQGRGYGVEGAELIYAILAKAWRQRSGARGAV